MKYVEWVERVFAEAALAVSEDVDRRLIGIPVPDLAKRLDLGLDPYAPGVDFHQSDERMAILDARSDLADLGLAESDQDYHRFSLTERGRIGHKVRLSSAWPQILRDVRVDDEHVAFLRRAVERSEEQQERFAIMREVTAEDVFADLGWTWNMGHALDITERLKEKTCLHSIPTTGGPIPVRITYIGVVRATEAERTEDQERLRELLDDWETTTVDFKRELDLSTPTSRMEFVRDTLAVATTQGRQRRFLVIGFDDKTRAFHHSVDPGITQDRLEDILNQYVLAQPPGLKYRTVPSEGGEVGLMGIVRDATQVPYRGNDQIRQRYKSDVFVRRLSHIAVPDAEELASLASEAAAARARLSVGS